MRLILAPMEGVIDHTMRNLLTSLGGLDRCVTEFVRINDRLLPSRVFKRLCPELDSGGRTATGVPVYVQLLGGRPEPMAENAARVAELGALGIDINFGCPAKTVNRSDGGSIILREPERVQRIVEAVRKAVPSELPVTVKIRLGYEDPLLFKDNVQAIGSAGASELAIHARTKKDGYRPPAYWDHCALAQEWLSIPVIANGEIWSVEDAKRCREISRCPDLMLGRGALCRPDLARLIASASADQPVNPLSWQDITALLLDFFEATIENYDAHYVGNPLKQWLVYLRTYYPQAAVLFENIKRLRHVDDIQPHLQQELDRSRCSTLSAA
ncbi:tRNA-dihydrouridine synthase [Parahaliea sp. F7430]|uniref:tRNA-dihydrouridine(16) synthase n=1 Tax=Sediminihaliea albiluteola TaxID=2758564 RepID=A0A7W2YHW7_9GAMM|nr:tRNA-dihydrouridine synthase [Sediminihaliea albiluteola]MBA6411876.1 tRNA-dihydrouridine synthase [Sediminihaliea albiluteola]